MIETENPAIKLFGQSIIVPLFVDSVRRPPPPLTTTMGSADDEEGAEGSEGNEETEQDRSEEEAIRDKRTDDEPSLTEEELTSPESADNPQTPSINEETTTGKDSDDSPKSQEKAALKKPDKILPCPRCNSMDTKFCYYNNYNVNQPRHFCKSCQRYWTAGGTMRNVPVGAGRRKSKSSASRYCHISLSEALQAAARVESPNNGTHRHYLNSTPNGTTVLTFGSNHHNPSDCHSYEPERAAKVSVPREVNRDERSIGNPSTEFSSSNLNINGVSPQPQVPCLGNVPSPWPYGVPVQFYPPAFWGCGNAGIPNTWNFPLVSHPNLIAGPNPPILGKHRREGDVTDTNDSDESNLSKPKKAGSVLIPKTLRIDDPNEAAKSSIWATLGIKNECGSKGGMFMGFRSANEARAESEKCRVMCANPAALSRSVNFHETT